MNTTAGAPDFSAYIRDGRMVVQILLTTGAWLSVFEPCLPKLAVEVAEQIVATGHNVNYVRIVSVEYA